MNETPLQGRCCSLFRSLQQFPRLGLEELFLFYHDPGLKRPTEYDWASNQTCCRPVENQQGGEPTERPHLPSQHRLAWVQRHSQCVPGSANSRIGVQPRKNGCSVFRGNYTPDYSDTTFEWKVSMQFCDAVLSQVLHDFHAFAQVSEADVSCLMESTDMLDALRGQINLCHSHIEELNVRHQQVWSLKQKIIFFTLHITKCHKKVECSV